MALDRTILALMRLRNNIAGNNPGSANKTLAGLMATGYEWHCAHDVKSLATIIGFGRETLTLGQQSTALALATAELRTRNVKKYADNGFIAFIGTPKHGYRVSMFRSGRWPLAVKKDDHYIVDRMETSS